MRRHHDSGKSLAYIILLVSPFLLTGCVAAGAAAGAGMSKEDVRFVKGDPKRTKEEEGRTVWVYGTVSQRKRVYFEDGKVVDHNF